MLRVSLDSIIQKEETLLRRPAKRERLTPKDAYEAKLTNIQRFLSAGVYTAIQTVVWRKNDEPLHQMIDWLSVNGIKRWYLQRLIPSYKFRKPSPRFALEPSKYYSCVAALSTKARAAGIECVPKMDLRHNSVFLLTADGVLYTQGAKAGQKVRLGTIRERIEYYDYVSASDHACRYYLPDRLQKTAPQSSNERRASSANLRTDRYLQ